MQAKGIGFTRGSVPFVLQFFSIDFTELFYHLSLVDSGFAVP